MPRPPSPPNTSSSLKYELFHIDLWSIILITNTFIYHYSSYKSYGQSSQYKFGVLTKIVKYIRARHQDGDDHPLTLDELLDETNQLDVGTKVKTVLI